MDFRTRIVVPAAVLARELEGESVLLNLDTERYYGLDQVGTRMWNVMTQSDSLQVAFDILVEEYDVDPETLRQDMTNLVQELLSNGLLAARDD